MSSLVTLPQAVRLKITLHVYSGRPDPFWFIPVEAAQELMDRIGKISNALNMRPQTVKGGLGYRGFSISNIESQIGWYIHEGIVDLGSAAQMLVAGSREIEHWLLDVGGSIISSAVQFHVAESLGSAVFARTTGSGSGCPKCVAADAPALNLSRWNTAAVQPKNNCYNYANDRLTNTFAQPGNASGKSISSNSCSGVQPLAVSDGLVAAPNFSAALAAKKGFYVALVIWPGQDFHWYRQDNTGCWSHKPGHTPARNTDNSGAAISNPQTCDRGPYTDFCSFMITDSSVKIS
jgi:hypothetical protein